MCLRDVSDSWIQGVAPEISKLPKWTAQLALALGGAFGDGI